MFLAQYESDLRNLCGYQGAQPYVGFESLESTLINNLCGMIDIGVSFYHLRLDIIYFKD